MSRIVWPSSFWTLTSLNRFECPLMQVGFDMLNSCRELFPCGWISLVNGRQFPRLVRLIAVPQDSLWPSPFMTFPENTKAGFDLAEVRFLRITSEVE